MLFITILMSVSLILMLRNSNNNSILNSHYIAGGVINTSGLWENYGRFYLISWVSSRVLCLGFIFCCGLFRFIITARGAFSAAA